jgi:GntP family gluconate:H+ symporter
MSYELIILLAMLAVFVLGVFKLKMPAGLCLMLAGVVGALVGGEGLPVRHLVEGGFAFFDPILIIAVGMIFMEMMGRHGVLSSISVGMLRLLHRWPTVLMLAIVVFVMLPGMLTGLATMCILTTGALAMPILIAMGMPRLAAGSLIVMLSVCGEVAPPICIPAMIIGGGVDMPYIGLAKPLLLASFPIAVVLAVVYRYRHIKRFDVNEVLAELAFAKEVKHGALGYLPMIFVIVYMIGETVFHEIFPHLGIPLIFAIGIIIGLITGGTRDLLEVARAGLRKAMPVMAILVGVGVFLQILALTGVRGYLTVNALFLPDTLKYLIAAMMPFLGSAYGSASIIGVPLLYVFIGKNELVVTSSLVLMASMGDLMPPPSRLCAYAAQMLDEKNHFKILRTSIPAIVFAMIIGLAILIFAGEIADLIHLR